MLYSILKYELEAEILRFGIFVKFFAYKHICKGWSVKGDSSVMKNDSKSNSSIAQKMMCYAPKTAKNRGIPYERILTESKVV